MSLEDMAPRAGWHITQLHAAVFPGDGHAFAIGRIGQGENRLRIEQAVLAIVHRGYFIPAGDVPELHQPIRAARGQALAVRGEGNVPDASIAVSSTASSSSVAAFHSLIFP